MFCKSGDHLKKLQIIKKNDDDFSCIFDIFIDENSFLLKRERFFDQKHSFQKNTKNIHSRNVRLRKANHSIFCNKCRLKNHV